VTVTKIPEGQYGKITAKFKPTSSSLAKTKKEI
jgi:hypothetical protein